MEMQEKISRAFEGEKGEKVSGDITRQDLYRLTGSQECNDMLLDVYFKLVEERSSVELLAPLYSFNTKAYEKMGTPTGNAKLSESFKDTN